VQQAREGEAWLVARGRYEHLVVARTRISDGYRARAHAIVALARSLRPTETLPGAPAAGLRPRRAAWRPWLGWRGT
jgi:hypothetical protein